MKKKIKQFKDAIIKNKNDQIIVKQIYLWRINIFEIHI